jgi:hypothetical protein
MFNAAREASTMLDARSDGGYCWKLKSCWHRSEKKSRYFLT